MFKMKKSFVIYICLVLISYSILPNTVMSYAANSNTANRMNVVFVLDGSGSMANTDRSMLRYEAVELFLGLATDTGNYMGALVFDHSILLQQDISLIDGSDAKKALLSSIRDAQTNGDTDIGMAIEVATQMLSSSGNPDLPSAIILLSDGNTDLPPDTSGVAMQASQNSKAAAIDAARDREYRIHSICLNTNGAANVMELQEISDVTGGTCVEVKNADDLKSVFSQFYDIIFSTKTVTIVDTIIPENEEVEMPFTIPKIGVEEANIIINTLNTNTSYTLFQPSGVAFTQEELESLKITAKTFSVIKIPKPESGEWKLVAKGISGDQIKIDMIYNSQLSLNIDVNNNNLSGHIGDQIPITAHLVNEGLIVEREDVYTDYPMKVSITNLTTGESNDYDMEANGSEAKYILDELDYTEYDVQIYSTVDMIPLYSEVIRLSIINSDPYVINDPIVINKFIAPFADTVYLEELDRHIQDAEDESLAYSIVSSDYDNSVVSLEDNLLSIQLEMAKKGELVIQATDSQGAVVMVGVQIKIVSWRFLLLVVLLPVLLIIIGMILFVRLKTRNRVIRGRIQVSAYREGSFLGTPSIFHGEKGKMLLGRYLDVRADVGVNLGQTYFMAGENESFIYLISKSGYYTEHDPDTKNRKIRLDNETELNISSDIDFEKGIKVTYIPDDMY